MIINYQEADRKIIKRRIKRIEKLFDDEFYAAQYPGNNGRKKQYVRHHSFLGRFPNPLFNPTYYRIKYLTRNTKKEPLCEYLNTFSAASINPHVLFQSEYYNEQVKRKFRRVSALEHYLKQPFKKNISPTPLFDPLFYKTQNLLDVRPNEPALLHYLRVGESLGFKPNESFNPEDYTKPLKPNNWSSLAYSAISKLEYYALEQEEMLKLLDLKPLLNTHQYFQDKELAAKIFDEQYYLSHNQQSVGQHDPLDHYLQVGSALGRYPHPLFNSNFYRYQYELQMSEEPVIHYLRSSSDNQPHQLFDPLHYRRMLEKQNIKPDVSLLEHFTQHGFENNFSPCADFDTKHYRQEHPYIRIKKLNPLIHYLKTGEKLGYNPSKNFFPIECRNGQHLPSGECSILEKKHQGLLNSRYPRLDPFLKQLENLPSEVKKILIVSHEASLTGAPLIILKFAEMIKEHHGLQPVFVIGGRGKLVPRFSECGPTYVFDHWNTGVSKNRTITESDILSLGLKKFDFQGIVMNSVESRILISTLAKIHHRIMFLIHEFGDMYPDNSFDEVGQLSRKIIFPCEMISQFAQLNSSLPINKIRVHGQGLLNEDLLRADKHKYQKKLKESLGIPQESVVVLGCGTIEKRKGVDLFVNAAIKALPLSKVPLYFIWVGGVHFQQVFERKYFEWILKDIELQGFSDKIRFTGEVTDSSKYFLGSDIMFLSSRRDPFPCVMHEAMASKLPVICFDQSGGHAEVFGDGTGIVVPYANSEEAGQQIAHLANNRNLRSNIAKRSYKKVINQFDFKNYADWLMRQFSSIKASGI